MILQMGFTISSEYAMELTQVPNWFIRTYMPSANGNFVKLYLYLVMVCQHPAVAEALSVNLLADCLECTENDILRALRYWQKEGLLSYKEKDGEILSIVLLEKGRTESIPEVQPQSQSARPSVEPPASQEFVAATAEHFPAAPKEYKLPVRQEYTPLQAEALIKDVEIDQTISRVEQLLGTTVSATHLQMILYFMCDVGFTQELILAMYQTALNKGKNSPKYIEAIGISWAKKGITSAEEAGVEAASFGGIYHVVSKSLGIQRSLAPAEREIIDQWQTYGFTDDIIQEACRRTVLQTGSTNLKYVSSILEKWNHQQVSSLADIEKCDESFKQQKKSGTGKKPAASKNQFQNFPQRTYSKEDYSALEKQLLRGVQV